MAPLGPSVPKKKTEGLERWHRKRQGHIESWREKYLIAKWKADGENQGPTGPTALLVPYENLHKGTSC